MDTRVGTIFPWVVGALIACGSLGCHMRGYHGGWGYHGPMQSPPPPPATGPVESSPPAFATETPHTVDDVAEPSAPPPSFAENNDTAEITGNYRVHGTDQSGVPYDGTALITKQKANMYDATWKLGQSTWHALIFRDKNLLSCGTAPKHDLGVMAYLATGDQLEGIWFEEQHVNTGFERLIRGPVVSSDLVGSWAIALGETPAKKKYKGNVNIMRWQNGVYGVTWKFQSGLSLRGVGLRSWKLPGVTQDILSVGFNDSGDATILQFVVQQNGAHLRGHWAMPNANGAPSWGVETLQRM